MILTRFFMREHFLYFSKVKKHVLTVGIRDIIFEFYENDKKWAKNDFKKDIDSMNLWRLKIS
jgi:hypothetical protein